MTTKELLLQEIEALPESVLAQLLVFLHTLKTNQTDKAKSITLVSASGEIQVSQTELICQEQKLTLSPLATPATPMERVRQELKQALEKAGYTNRASIIELVQDVKREILLEREVSRRIMA